MSSNIISSGVVRPQIQARPHVVTMLVCVVVIAALYLGKPILIPLAIAILLAFVLTPIVKVLRRIAPRSIAVLSSVLLSLMLVAGSGLLIADQLHGLAQEVPRYEFTLREKVRNVREMFGKPGAISAASKTIEHLTEELEKPGADKLAGSTAPPKFDGAAVGPIPVTLAVREPNVIENAKRILVTMIEPVAMIAAVFLFLTFILFQREDVRDRMIRLFGASDLQRTTAAMNDGASRLSRFFLTQTVLNAGFGAAICIGLFLIGVPNAILWGFVAFLMRFVPFVGSFIAAAFPIMLAAAFDPGWTTMWLVVALFLIAEPLMGHVIEPIVQGQSTGLSPLAVLVSASFWTLLWGPIGLMLAVPLTAMLVVLGRHVDSLEFFDILLGDTPALTNAEKFYQRALTGDGAEVTDQAEACIIESRSLSSFYDTVAFAGLRLAQRDADRRALHPESEQRIVDTVFELVDNLGAVDVLPRSSVEGAGASDSAIDGEADAEGTSASKPLPNLQDVAPRSTWSAPSTILCVAGRTRVDEAAAMLVWHVLTQHGFGARVAAASELTPAAIRDLDTRGIQCAIVCALGDKQAMSQTRFVVRRLRRFLPDAGMIGLLGDGEGGADSEKKASMLGLDANVTSSREVVEQCLKMAGALPAKFADGENGELQVSARDNAESSPSATPPMAPAAAG